MDWLQTYVIVSAIVTVPVAAGMAAVSTQRPRSNRRRYWGHNERRQQVLAWIAGERPRGL